MSRVQLLTGPQHSMCAVCSCAAVTPCASRVELLDCDTGAAVSCEKPPDSLEKNSQLNALDVNVRACLYLRRSFVAQIEGGAWRGARGAEEDSGVCGDRRGVGLQLWTWGKSHLMSGVNAWCCWGEAVCEYTLTWPHVTELSLIQIHCDDSIWTDSYVLVQLTHVALVDTTTCSKHRNQYVFLRLLYRDRRIVTTHMI